MVSRNRIGVTTTLAGHACALLREGTATRRLIDQSVESFGDNDASLVIEFSAAGRDLQGLTALTAAIQLAVESATVAVRYAIARGAKAPVDRSLLGQLASEPGVRLEIEWLAAGSFNGTIKAYFLDSDNRTVVLSVATVATVIMGVIVPPLTAPALIVSGVVGLGDILNVAQARRGKKRQAKAAAEARRIDANEKAKTAKQLAEMNEHIDQMEKELRDLQKKVGRTTRASNPIADTDSIVDARVERLDFIVEVEHK
jgi:hypothetical protein